MEFRVQKLYSNFEWALESFWAFFSSLILKDPWCPQVAAALASIFMSILFSFLPFLSIVHVVLCSWVFGSVVLIFQQVFSVLCLLISFCSVQFVSYPILFGDFKFYLFLLVQFDNMRNFHESLDLVLVLVSSCLRTLIQF